MTTESKSGSPLEVGDLVEVAARTFPGMNKHGGVGRVTRVDDGCIDVKYVLGGKEANVEFRWVRRHDPAASEELRERRARRRASAPPSMMAQMRRAIDNMDEDDDEDALVSRFTKNIRLAAPQPMDETDDSDRANNARQHHRKTGASSAAAAKSASNDKDDNSMDEDEDGTNDQILESKPRTDSISPSESEQTPGAATAESEQARRNTAPTTMQINDVVFVAPRTGPGQNKPGGTARITKINHDNATADVKYILGGSDRAVPLQIITSNGKINNNNNNNECENGAAPAPQHLRQHRTDPLPSRTHTNSANKRRPRDATNVPTTVSRKLKRVKLPAPSESAIPGPGPSAAPPLPAKDPAPGPEPPVRSPAERARQQTFRQLVARLFRTRQAEMMDASELMKLVNESNCENDGFAPAEFEARLRALDEENRVMLRTSNGATSVWLV